MARLSNLYLFCYNSVQAFGWAVALFRISIDFLSTKSINGAYASAGELICLLQTLGFIEVIHGAVGIVPSGFLFPLMQWGGRTHFLLAIIRRIDEVHELPVVFITFVAWCCIEVIRYPFYALSCLGNCPSFLTYLRYTVFIVIYPIGVVGEMWLMYQALPVIMEKNLYGDYFSAMPFSYHAFVKAVLICYPFLWLQLYLYLFKQRRSKLRPRNKEKKRE
ncbi:very-long-chain (3R)-3-hydroxyacyl-CoA dehydratase 2 [Cynara cardunculus var. scolymus]|uniref:very-long-chain (3R)-3-hydroxyacyl-CoA dehydratase 2 n=1 Tax=Cynara cardunculus var. scolymus TaxID=59895 RepID=UPI000D62FFCC|nr:very-long-chain (3R)-3-hydroxyacyl-CoA dehydratase 2 [Cynara cardunculus var. scolymus]